jgi:hypothetical protein
MVVEFQKEKGGAERGVTTTTDKCGWPMDSASRLAQVPLTCLMIFGPVGVTNCLPSFFRVCVCL